MRKLILLTVATLVFLVGCQDNNQGNIQENAKGNNNSITISVEQPELKSYIEEAYKSDSIPDIQWHDSPAVSNLAEEEQNKAIQISKEVLVSLEVVEEIDDYNLKGEFISAKYRAGFNYFVFPGAEEPHNSIYIDTKDNKVYKLKADKEAVQKLIRLMNDLKGD